ncbi:hypothetical protein C4565_04220 [Candidatus Parcubacteria bacterium]|jgi:hypothetical protein|nr:MAG: hypothetical protein C4565_04220 [Candidatus Parcubacteria bacterium]
MSENKVIAISQFALSQWGCPHCGYRSGYMPIQVGGSAMWICGECQKRCAVLADGITRSKIAVGAPAYYPELQPHPLEGTPKHGRPDKKPVGGGEYFRSRGIGLDETPGCFVCGGSTKLHSNIAAFVQCKEAGERIVKMFETGARLDYREHEPDRIQVKIGACDKHFRNLEMLHNKTSETGTIVAEMIFRSKTEV